MDTFPTLKAAWLELAGRFSDDLVLNNQVFAELQRKYTSQSRHYHNLTHLQAMLTTVENQATRLEDADAVRFAVWFHDAVYQPIRSDNEAKSADLAAEALKKMAFPDQRINQVKQLILRTHNHTERLPDEDADTGFFLDCDLQILGSDRPTYEAYTRQIRREYRMFPDFVYKPGRLNVLQKFVAMPFIYQTTIFRELLEKQARENLLAEIAQLQ